MDQSCPGSPAALLRLLSFASPAFPTGGFAYSQGLEWAVEAGQVQGAAGLLAWLDALLRHGSARSEAILLRHAWRASCDDDALAELDSIAVATCLGSERRMETQAQGAAFAVAARAWGEVPALAYPVAFGVAAARQGIGENAACLGFLANWVSNLMSAAIRLGILGQAAGLSMVVALEPACLTVAAETRSATVDDLGGACFFADIASMRHETQYARLFRS